MTNARTFFDINKRQQIQIDPETRLTIGSLDDLKFVHDIWARDSEAQKFKLSELQKRCLELLPEYTDDEAFNKVEELNNELDGVQSRGAKKKLKEDAPLLKSLAKKLNVNPQHSNMHLTVSPMATKRVCAKLDSLTKYNSMKRTRTHRTFTIKSKTTERAQIQH